MKLTYKEYANKVKGCFTGKNIGGTLGAPFECWRGVFNVDFFMQDISTPVPNDDLDLQLVWLAAIEREGKNIDSRVLGEYWETYVSSVISEYGAGKNNFAMGVMPPLSGYMHNENRESNGAWIRTEIWACLTAGNPALAANYAYYDASVDHSDEGIYAAVFTAAVESAAFFESDANKLIDIGLSYIPENCATRGAVELVRESFRAGDDWKTARKKLLIAYPSSFGEIGGEWQGTKLVPACDKCPVQQKDPDIPKATHGFDAPAHIGIVLIGWLWGEGDFGKSVCLATNCGEDTDCTAGTLGALLGIIGGEKCIPEKWKKACSDKIATCTLRPDLLLNLPETVTDLCERVVKQFPVVSSNACTFTERGFEITPNKSLAYDPDQFFPFAQEDCFALLAEQTHTARFHFRPYTVRVRFDDSLACIRAGVQKTLTVTVANALYVPQYLTLRAIGLPEDWSVSGAEQCLSLNHWHGSKREHTQSYTLTFTPASLPRGKYELTLEISANGRGERNYVPLTFIAGTQAE
ncbi:MAG: ADP-ribosylglycohydrolase family protein [Clostridiales bacterium]|nr:ADP-ribosylglycohydrolase family protein [Clostridiales bacterium]